MPKDNLSERLPSPNPLVGGWRNAPAMISAFLNNQTMLPLQEEIAFRQFWRENVPVYKQGPDPWPKGHGYDYRKAYQAGLTPPGVGIAQHLGPLMERQGDGERPHWYGVGKLPGMSPERYLVGDSGKVYDSTRTTFDYVVDPLTRQLIPIQTGENPEGIEPYRYLLDETNKPLRPQEEWPKRRRR